ncbi:MAG: AAA family ATPase [Candidatus Lokiarchaeota archaeon]|nr:AAA family ATPase [Candidatus Lokiarchaeota archaeon]
MATDQDADMSAKKAPQKGAIIAKDEPLVFTHDLSSDVSDFWWSNVDEGVVSEKHFKKIMDAFQNDSFLVERLPPLTLNERDLESSRYYIIRCKPSSALADGGPRSDLEWIAAKSYAGKYILAWVCTLEGSVFTIRAPCLQYPHPQREYEIEVHAESASLVSVVNATKVGMTKGLLSRIVKRTARTFAPLARLVVLWEEYINLKLADIAMKTDVGYIVSDVDVEPAIPGAYHFELQYVVGKLYSPRDRVMLVTLPPGMRATVEDSWGDIVKLLQASEEGLSSMERVDAGTVHSVSIEKDKLVVDVFDAKPLSLPAGRTSFLITNHEMEYVVYETAWKWLKKFACYMCVNPRLPTLLFEPALATVTGSSISVDPAKFLDDNIRTDRVFKENIERLLKKSGIFLVQGVAGSGKSTLIAELIKIVTDQCMRVLLTAQSHVAVDQPLEKLARCASILPLRIGYEERITEKGKTFHHPLLLYKNWIEGLRNFLQDKAREKDDAFREALSKLDAFQNIPDEGTLKFFYKTYIAHWNVLALTTYEAGKLSKIRDIIGYIPTFDVAIIDEASRATPLDIFAVAMLAKLVIIVGDPDQLAPVFVDRNSKDLEKFESLVKFPFFAYLLSKCPPDLVISMLEQHRQHSQILKVSNMCIAKRFGGISSPKLLASEHVTRDFPFTFSVKQYGKNVPGKPHFYFMTSTGTSEEYLSNPLASVSGEESKLDEGEKGKSPVNRDIARTIIKLITDVLRLLDAHPDVMKRFLGATGKIVVITFYSEQKRLYQKIFYDVVSSIRFKNLDAMKVVEFDTVDHFQGDQQPMVIVDVVVTGLRSYSEFFKDFRRLYVSCSRARNLLLLVAAENTTKLNIPVELDMTRLPWQGDEELPSDPGTSAGGAIERRHVFREMIDYAGDLGSFMTWVDVQQHDGSTVRYDPTYLERQETEDVNGQ